MQESPYSNAAELYDFIYENSDFRNYEAETQAAVQAIKQYHPLAKTILDVGCATGEHARYLTKHYQVDGIDIEPEFVGRAQAKNPQGRFWVASMLDFDIEKTYDVLLCLGSAIGYLGALDNLTRALTNFERHLSPNGAILVEPWFSPENWRPGGINMVTAETKEKKVCRMVRTEQEGRLSVLYFCYLIGTASGFSTRFERHVIALFTTAEFLGAFDAAGLAAQYDPDGLGSGRGLYVGRRQ